MDKPDVLRRLSIVYIFMFLAVPISYLIRILYARSLTIEEYGLFYSILAFIGLIGVANDLGMNLALVHYIPNFLKDKAYGKIKAALSIVFCTEVITSIMIIGIIFLLNRFLAESFFKTNVALIILPMLTLAYSFENILGGIVHTFKGYQKEWLYSSLNPIRLLFILICSFIFSFIFKENLLFVFSLTWILSNAINILIYSIPFFRITSIVWKEKLTLDKSLFSLLLKYGFFVMIISLTGTLFTKVNVIMLTYMGGLQEVALYETAYPLCSVVLILINPLSTFLFPQISKMFHEGDLESVKNIIAAIYNTGLFLFLPLMFIFLLFPQEIISVTFGSKFLSAKTAVQILAVGGIFQGLNRINFSILDGIGQIKKRSHILYWGAGTNVLLNLILIPLFGIEGAALATSAGFSIMFLLSTILLRKHVRLTLPYKNWIKLLVCCAIFSVVILLFKLVLNQNAYAEAILAIIIGGSIYLIVGLKWKIIDYKLIKDTFLDAISQKKQS